MSSRPSVPAEGTGWAVRAGDNRWIMPAALLVLCQYVAALAMGHASGFIASLQAPQYMVFAFGLSILGGCIISVPKTWRLWREREPHPVTRLVREADRTAVASYLIGFQLVAWQTGALTWLKNMLPAIIPYWADPALATLDRALLGTDAWRLVPESLVRPLDIIYVSWGPVQTIALIFILCLRPSRIKARAMLAYFLTVGLMGVCGQYLLSSAGPVFYDHVVGSDRFADLGERLNEHAEFVKIGASYLWSSYSEHTQQFGNGISAMPSIHVATTTWIALSVSAVWPKLRVPLWGYWLAIFTGSFALGWHYLLDSLAGTVGALGCWVLADRLLAHRAQEPESRALAPIG